MSVEHSTQNKIKFKFKHQRGTFQSFQRSNFLAQESALEPIEQRVPYHRSWEIRSVCPTTTVQCATVFPTTVYYSLPQCALPQSTTVYHSLPQSTIVWYSLPQCTTMYPTTDLEDSISMLAEKKTPLNRFNPTHRDLPDCAVIIPILIIIIVMGFVSIIKECSSSFFFSSTYSTTLPHPFVYSFSSSPFLHILLGLTIRVW